MESNKKKVLPQTFKGELVPEKEQDDLQITQEFKHTNTYKTPPNNVNPNENRKG